jgi:hypothetical protein
MAFRYPKRNIIQCQPSPAVIGTVNVLEVYVSVSRQTYTSHQRSLCLRRRSIEDGENAIGSCLTRRPRVIGRESCLSGEKNSGVRISTAKAGT